MAYYTKYNYLGAASDLDKVLHPREEILDGVKVISELGKGIDGTASLVKYKGVKACMKDANLGQDLMAEAEVLYNVDGAGGAPRLMAACEDGSVLMMEYCRGLTLKNYFKYIGSQDDLDHIAEDVRRQVEALHKAGYSHGDIHTSNVMVCGKPGNRYVRLIDFGYAEELDDDGVENDWKEVKQMLKDLREII